MLSNVLSDPKNQKKHSRSSSCRRRRPSCSCRCAIGDYSDFYTGIYHAQNAGRLFRPDNPLLPNYHWVPIGYHGRASSVVVSGTPVVRPNGQTKAPDAPAPGFGPSKRLDFELELGFVIGPGNALGKPVPIAKALDHVFGVALFNDWSARDIQAWEYQPLGPFLAKSFASTMSPWIVTLEALEPFRCAAFSARPATSRRRLPTCPTNPTRQERQLRHPARSASAHARRCARPHCLSRSNFRHAYWTPAQIVTHQASNGCNLQPGDLLGSGTISGPTPDALGALLEMTQGGKNPVALPGGETRTFLEDGDEVILRGRCVREGCASIGFGEAAGVIKPAR